MTRTSPDPGEAVIPRRPVTPRGGARVAVPGWSAEHPRSPADEIVAFARAFELPVTFFFMPPVPWAGDLPVRLDTPDAGPLGKALAKTVDLVFGERHNIGLLSIRLEQFLDLGGEPLTDAQHRIETLANVRLGKLIQKAFRDLERWQTQLRSMANQLEGMVTQAKAAVWQDTDLPEDYRQ